MFRVTNLKLKQRKKSCVMINKSIIRIWRSKKCNNIHELFEDEYKSIVVNHFWRYALIDSLMTIIFYIFWMILESSNDKSKLYNKNKNSILLFISFDKSKLCLNIIALWIEVLCKTHQRKLLIHYVIQNPF